MLGSGGGFYEYDFGDSWLHRLELASRRPRDENSSPAQLIDGARRGPLEDSGGLPGFEDIIDALEDSSHPDHDEHAAWVAGLTDSIAPFNPAFLDIPAVNRAPAEQF
ncbi:plasmid pRiA4b ORF-3 family protein [Arthrobacter sp. D1-29]